MTKCNYCKHDLKYHYCEIVIGHDMYGKPSTPTKHQSCKKCGVFSGQDYTKTKAKQKCQSCTKDNLDISKPILDFWGWHV